MLESGRGHGGQRIQFWIGTKQRFFNYFPSIHPVQSEALVDIMNEVQDKILEHDRQRSITMYMSSDGLVNVGGTQQAILL
jgi:hypothetical protein